jgi:predicted nucleic acid-binding protein
MRILVDSSTLIALAKIGELHILKDIFGKVSITDVVRKEVLRDDFPETATLKAAMDMWIEIINFEGDAGELRKYGLGLGEGSLLLVARHEDRLVLDDANARRFAESKELRFIGLIGLLIGAVKTKRLKKEKAAIVLDKLARSDFRISSDLLLWAKEEIGQQFRKQR